jgi:hypothetical protein
MIKRIVILNSNVYGKASIRLDDCNSIQLVGPNNIGKSTLIYTLNFLFIIDGKKMSFSGNKSEKDTLHHYFPTLTNSYILFEIFKQRYYFILVKRGEDGLEYYRVESEYKEELFIDTERRVRKFEEVRTNIISSGIGLHEFRDKKEVFSFIYQRGKRNNAAIWLDDSVVTDGLSNNFSKVYRYLINSKLINNKTLKDALIIADNRDKEGINFSQKDRRDIVNLLKANDEIKIFESIKNDFSQFREVVNQYKGKEKIVRELIYSFNQQFTPSRIEFDVRAREKGKEIEDLTFNVNEELKNRQQKLDREIGGMETEIETKRKQCEDYDEQLNEINSFDSLEFIQQSIDNLDIKRKDIEVKLTQIDTRGMSLSEVENRLSTLKQRIETKSLEISNYSKRLIQNIADKQETKEYLNFILSEDFLSNLTSQDVAKKISQIDEIMNLFNGQVKISFKLKSKPLASLEELEKEVKSMKIDYSEYESLIPILKDVSSKKSELNSLEKEIEGYKAKLTKINSKENIEKTLSQLRNEVELQEKSKVDKEKAIKQLKEEIFQKEESIKILREQKKEYETRLKTIQEQKIELEQLALEPIENDSTESLENIYKKIRLFNKDREELKGNKDRLFDKLKDKVKSTLASEDEFIKYVEDEIACLPDKRNSIDGYLQAISVQFANPSASLIRRYNEFKEFVYNKFNSKLSKTKFSDIESLKIELIESKSILDELRKISSIQDLKAQSELDFGQSDNLSILNHYLDSGKKIDFHELFELELHLTKGGKDRKVDLKEQVESDGTDRMIRLVIVMTVINRLALTDKDNKIVIFIDEIATIDGHNRRELLKFCKEHNFIPICASPDETILDGFEKYVFLFRPQGGAKVNINENQPNVMFRKNLVNDEAN